ncbi:protein TASOR 2 [Rhineura floridana]|uniref:protein TASOR 2 n=1 Tax=Rhineura floridana TaxID=261503 RepID=UPI002AC87960|nr:protein TASOR 2 [Rhineura floridana]XP_061494036.1 protein TASOR 2 [Rhineura floridana]XP_061494037.1 protein TASOR 2 [Rhineura floridana]
MSPLNHKSLAECKTKALYRAWKGQLFIQEQRVCDIILRSPFSDCIPAQLPARLEIRYVVAVSDLRKKLPEAVFGKNNYANHEVCYQGISFHLYEVEILSQNEQKVNQLIDGLKEKDLALVRYLNDRGILILLASSALAKEKDSGPDESTCLQALFLISSSRPKCLTARDLKCKPGGSERSLQVALVLPGLRHAVAEAVKHPDDKGTPLNALVKLHLQDSAKLAKNLRPTSSSPNNPPFSFDLFSMKIDLDTLSEKCPQSSFSRLQHYLSHPQNYTLEMSAAAACLDGGSQSLSRSGNVQDADSSSGLSLDSLPPDGATGTVETGRTRCAGQSMPRGRDAPGKTSQAGERTLQRCKRKSSRLLGASARKKWSPLKVLCIMDSSKKRKKTRKKKASLSPPASKHPGSPGVSNEPTLKLKKLQNPLRRKRGAEVLSAEFVQRTRCELAVKAVSSSEGLGVQEKKPRLLKHKKGSAAEKVTSKEKMSTRSQVKRKSARCSMDKIPLASKGGAGDGNNRLGERTAPLGACLSPKRDECDSHALNMLADLALSSNSPLLSNGNGASVPFSPSRERRRFLKGKVLGKSSDHEYHRVTKKWKGASLFDKAFPESLSSPGQTDQSTETPSSSQERGRAGSSKKGGTKSSSSQSHAVPLKETGYLSDSSMHSLISSEHSYASLASEPSKKGGPGSPSSKNGVKNSKAGPLVGKVLPFRHQQNICHPPKQFKNYVLHMRSAIMAARLKEDFSKSHRVTICDKIVTVTFQWEAEYLLSLDSKYTNNSLEKTVIRAVHGPWDASLSDDVEEMKRILHMWVALFYSKPFKSPTVRKVVEHSNPAKYVSLNSIVDPLELTDDREGSYSLEKCPADSLSEANQTSSEAEERAVSPSEKPLSSNELSSTNCIEDEPPLVNPEDTNDQKEEQPHAAAINPEEPTHPFDEVAGEEPDEEHFWHPISSVESRNGNLSDECIDGCTRPRAYRTEAEVEASGAVNLAEVSQSDAASPEDELPADSAGKQPVATTMASISAENWETSAASPSAEEKGSSHRMLLHPSEAAWLEGKAECREDYRPCREAKGSQDLSLEEDIEGETMEWESIDLALSDSNDADLEPRDVDLDQENEEEESCVTEREMTSMCDGASPDDGSTLASLTSPVTVSEHLTELPGTQEDYVASAPNSASLNTTGVVEGFCFSQEDKIDNLVDSASLQASPVNQITCAEVTTSPRTEDAVESAKLPISLDQMDVIESSCSSLEEKEISLTESASESFQVQNDIATRGESVESQASLVLATPPIFSNPVDLVDISFVSTEGKGMNLADSLSQQASPVHETAPDEVTELPSAQEDSVKLTKHQVSLNQMDLIEDISQEDFRLADSSPLESCEQCQIQNNTSAQGASVGNQEDFVVSAPNLTPAKEMVLVAGSCASQEEGGIHPADMAELQGSPVYQTVSDEDAEMQSAASAKTITLADEMGLVDGSCIPQEKAVVHLADTAPLRANEPHKVQHSTVTQEEWKARQTTELLSDSPGQKEYQSLELDNAEFEANSENQKCAVKDENIGVSSVSQELASDDDKLRQTIATVPEEIKSFLCELMDTVSAMTVECGKACPKENSDLNWISSVTLECVTPPESDEESRATGQLAHPDPKWMPSEYSEQCNVSVGQERDLHLTLQGQGRYHSALHESMSADQVDMVERRSCEETKAAVDVFSSSCCVEWEKTGPKSPECKFPLVKSADSPKDDDSPASVLNGTDLGKASPEASISEGEDQFREECRETGPFVRAEHQVEYSSEGSGSPMHEDMGDLYEDARENPEDPEDTLHEGTGGNLGDLEDTLASERTELPTRATGMDKSISMGGDKDLFGGLHHRGQSERSCTRSTASPGATETDSTCELNLEKERHEGGDWMYLENEERVPDLEAEIIRYDWPLAFKGGGRSVLPSLETSSGPGTLKDYLNFSITMKHKETTRTFHSSKRRGSFAGELGFTNSSDWTWRVLNDPTQNTLDMECLRFHDKLKRILKKTQLPTSRDVFATELSPQVTAEKLPLRKVLDTPALSPPPRSRSPLLITILNLGPRYGAAPCPPTSSRYSDLLAPPRPPSPPLASSQDSVSKAARMKSAGQGPVPPFHLNKLTYNNKLKDFRGDISVIMDEFAELSRVMALGDRQASNRARDPNSPTSEDAPEKQGSSLPRRAASYEHLFTELCSTLHLRLKTVAQEACKKPYVFYLVETDDDPFFGRVKNLLKKGGHTEMKPLHFCKTSHPEADRLLVIIRNEDIFPHIHKIPSLLRLKYFPNVTFAGVDSPEDILDHTYQELFHSGGFVVSDDTVLETMTVGELKETVKTLEKLNGHGRWRWLLHYKETKKLREDARADSAAHAKEMFLKSCQGANLTDILHYHQCDSKSSLRSEHLNCLLNLQVQHIGRRFAVFLTEKPTTSREAMENKGILALDVNTFVATAEEMAAPFRRGCW